MRILIGTNVIVSALLLPRSLPRKLYDLAYAQCELISSAKLIMELQEVLSRPKIASRVSREAATVFIDAYVRSVEVVEPKSEMTVCRDPADNHVISIAVEGDARFLISGDSDLLVLGKIGEVRIVRPIEAFELLSIP